MIRAEGDEYQKIKIFFEKAAIVAKDATCLRAKCGSVIVKNSKIIGKGFNSPALNDESQRFCETELNTAVKPKYDKTCCIHAEWRAIIDACKTSNGDLTGSTLYFMRIDENNNSTDAGDPFCTVCSRLALESGIEKFALYNNQGADIYFTNEYNQKSYDTYLK